MRLTRLGRWLLAAGITTSIVGSPLLSPTPASAGPTTLSVVHFRHLASAGQPDGSFQYGTNGYQHLLCDFDGDGADGIVAFDGGKWYIRATPTPGAPETTVSYGAPGYVPICADWDGDGDDGIGVYVGGHWYLRNSATPGTPELQFEYGIAGYQPVAFAVEAGVGIGVFVDGTWHVRYSVTPGLPQASFTFGGTKGYRALTGDWDGDGYDGIAVFLDGKWWLRQSVSGGPVEATFQYGIAGYRPLAGAFGENKADGIAVVHP
jgi:hypothetical protein